SALSAIHSSMAGERGPGRSVSRRARNPPHGPGPECATPRRRRHIIGVNSSKRRMRLGFSGDGRMLGRASEWRGDGAPSPEATARALRLAEALAPGAPAELVASDPPAPTGDASLAAPVRRTDGAVVAILRLTELPSPPDPSLAERLQDVADLLASAFSQVHAVAAEPSADTAWATVAAVIE